MLPLSTIQERMAKLNNWALEGESIVKDFVFQGFLESVWFVNKVAEIAEKEQHHPDIIINYNNVRLVSTTHSERGLTSKDFDLAEKIDKIGKVENKTESTAN